MRDDTLDALLAAAIDSGDSAILSIIADRIEETGHPAAAWWRSWLTPQTRLARDGTMHHTVTGTSYLKRGLDDRYPGMQDLMRRIDGIRLHNILRM